MLITDYINHKVESLKEQLESPECTQPIRVEAKLEIMEELQMGIFTGAIKTEKEDW